MNKKRVLFFILALVMIFSLVPMGIMAEENQGVTISVPENADLFVGFKKAHYVPFTEVSSSSVSTENGVKTYVFEGLTEGDVYNVRVTMEGKITYCDYFKASAGAKFTFRAEADASVPDSGTVVTLTDRSGSDIVRSGYASSIYTNVGSTGQVSLAVGDSFRLRNFRVWQLVTDGIQNYFFEPDFHYTILSGEDVISFNESTRDITGLKAGTAVMMVTYDALEYPTRGLTSVTTTLTEPEKRTVAGSIWPENVGLFVVRVGDNGSVETGIDWDAEFDSYYYTASINGKSTGETNAEYTFTPEEGSTVSVLRPTLNANNTTVTYGDFSDEGVTEKDGKVTVTLNHGRNIIRVAKGDSASYQVITARPVDITYQDENGKQIKAAKPGQKVTVSYKGVSPTVYKMAGVYNPNTNMVEYPGGLVGSSAGQYVSGGMGLDLIIPSGYEDDTYSTSGTGQILISLWGDKPGDGHRVNITDEGRGVNTSAPSYSEYFSVLPQLSIDVTYEGVERQKVTFNNFPEDGTLTIIDDSSSMTYTKNTVNLPEGTYRYTVGKAGCMAQHGTFTVGNTVVSVDLEDMTAVSADTAQGAWDGITKTEPETVDGVYQIGTGAEFAWWAESVTKGNSNAKAVLTADIDLASYDWTPIEAYYGVFDGRNHTIKNLYLYNSGYQIGLFTTVADDAVLKNLTVDGEVILECEGNISNRIFSQKRMFVSAIACDVKYATIENCHNKANVTVTGTLPGGNMVTTGTVYIGGAFGRIYNSTVTGCTNSGDVFVPASLSTSGRFNTLACGVGGVAGSAGTLSAIQNCGNSGNVTVAPNLKTGGLFGICTYNNEVTGCYNKGDVSGHTYVGGLFGQIRGGSINYTDKNGQTVNASVSVAVLNCYNTGNVSSTSAASPYVGGLCGSFDVKKLKNCYTAGTVSAPLASGKTNVAVFGALSSSGNTATNENYDQNYYVAQGDLPLFGGYNGTNLINEMTVYGTLPVAFSEYSELNGLLAADGSEYVGDGKNAPFLYWEKDINAVSLTVKTPPDKLTYYYGRSFDPIGMVLEVKAADGSVYTLNGSNAKFSPETFTESGEQDVTVTYGGASATVKVNVHPKGTAPSFIVLPEEKVNVFEKNSGNHMLTFVADGEDDVTYKIYRSTQMNGTYNAVSSSIPNKITVSTTSTSVYFYYVEATVGETVLTSDIYTVKVLDKNSTYTLSCNEPEHGSISMKNVDGTPIENGARLYSGESFVVSLQADEGYAVKSYTRNGNADSYTGVRSISADTALNVEFSKARKLVYDAAPTTDDGLRKGVLKVFDAGNTDLAPGSYVGEGATIRVYASAAGSGTNYFYMDNYTVSGATLDESMAGNNTATYKNLYYTVDSGESDVVLEPGFTLGARVFMKSVSGGNYTYKYGETETTANSATLILPAGTEMTVTPGVTSASYAVTGMSVAIAGADPDAAVETGENYSKTFTTVAGNAYTVTVSTAVQYTTDISATGNGTLQLFDVATGEEIPNGSKIFKGAVVKAVATPDSGYALVTLKNYRTSIANNAERAVSNGTYTATFAKATAVNVKTSGEGTVTVKRDNVEAIENGGTVGDGAILRITATPAEGYVLSSLQVNGEDFTSNKNYTVSGNTNIRAIFSVDPETVSTVTYEQPENGSLTVTDSEGHEITDGEIVKRGTVLKFNAAADEGYEVTGITVNGETLAADGEYTVTDAETAIAAVVSEKTITVSFRLIGDMEHEDGVTDHDRYVTWIPTQSYTVPAKDGYVKGYEIFKKALNEAGIKYRYSGSDMGIYISGIQAPEVLGGYWLSEFDNGTNSGWMYTVSQTEADPVHPGVAISDCNIYDGQEIVFHYVDDYKKETTDDWNQGDPNYLNRWLEAEDIDPAEFAEKYAAANQAAADPVIAQINGLPAQVALSDKEAVASARKAYDGLTAAQKELVSEEVLSKLVNAENTIEQLEKEAADANKAAAKAVDDRIAAIGEVTLDSKEAIAAARNAYDALTDAQKALVTKLDALTAAEAKLAELEEAAAADAADKAAAKAVDDKIAAIGEVTRDSKDAIEAARSAYDALTDGQKALVTNADALLRAERDYAVLVTDLPFTDLKEDGWYLDSVRYVYFNGMMNGMSETTFEPDTALTRAMYVTMLYRLSGEPSVKVGNVYADVKGDEWYAKAVSWGTENGIVEGYDGKFSPMDSITREQMAAMMYRYAELNGCDVSASASFDSFSDGSTVSEWAKEEMSWAVASKLIQGHENGTLEPQGNATRAQAAAVLQRFAEMIQN